MESMTGYGQADGPTSIGILSVEVRSVNHRFCDIALKLPRKLSYLENRVKELVKSQLSRGRIDVSIRLDSAERNGYRLEPDLELARQYVEALRALKSKLKLKGEISLDMVAQFKDILVPVEEGKEGEAFWEEVREILQRSLDVLKEMRRREGAGLVRDLRERLRYIGNLAGKINNRAPSVLEEYRQRLEQRVRVMLSGTDLDPVRLSQEVAFFAERSDITEETVRLRSHLAQFEEMLDSKEPAGRKLDFLVQEIHREVNTVSSKANDVMISQAVVEIKGELEKIREQIQNIE